MRFFSHTHIFSRLYNLPPRQAFWSSRRPDSLAINQSMGHCGPEASLEFRVQSVGLSNATASAENLQPHQTSTAKIMFLKIEKHDFLLRG